MSVEQIIERLAIPVTRVSKRVPKKNFENSLKLTPAQKRYLYNDVELITLEYSLVQQDTQVLAVLNDEYNYSAINIISVKLNNIRNYKKIAKIINSAIPTANILIFNLDDKQIPICLIHTQLKRINQVDKSKMVLLEEYDSCWFDINAIAVTKANEAKFLEAVSYTNLIKFDLKVMYQDFVDKMVALELAIKLGYFSLDDIAEKKELLADITELERQNCALKKQQKKLVNFSDKTSLNMQIQTNKKSIEILENKLKDFSF